MIRRTILAAAMAAAVLAAWPIGAWAQEAGEPNDANSVKKTIRAFKDANEQALEDLHGNMRPRTAVTTTQVSQPTTTTAPTTEPASQPAASTEPPPPPPALLVSLADAILKLPVYFGVTGTVCVLLWLGIWVAMVRYSLKTKGMRGCLASSFLVGLAVAYLLTLQGLESFVLLMLWIGVFAVLVVTVLCAILKKNLPLAFATLVLSVLAFGLGEWNHINVSDIQEDRSAEELVAKKRQAKVQTKEAVEIRTKRKSSDIHFAEDDNSADIKKARYTEAELKKLRAAEKAAADANMTTAGKADTAGAGARKDDDDVPVDSDANTAAKTDTSAAEDPNSPMFAYRKGGPKARDPNKIDRKGEVLTNVVAKAERAKEPSFGAGARKLLGPELIKARMLNKFNLFAVRLTMIVALFLAVIEYLRRFNSTFDSIYPLPIASRTVDSMWPKTHAVHVRTDSDETVRQYLCTVVEKGESFLYVGSCDPLGDRLAGLPRIHEKLFWPLTRLAARRPWLACWLWRLTMSVRKIVWRVGDAAHSNHFVFESAWFGQYCFVVLADSLDKRLLTFLEDVMERLRKRRRTRATAWRTVNFVWCLPEPPPEKLMNELTFLCRETNCKLVLFQAQAPCGDTLDFYEEVVKA